MLQRCFTQKIKQLRCCFHHRLHSWVFGIQNAQGVGGFAVRDKEFEAKPKYSDWKFIYAPPSQPNLKSPATPPLLR